jgi:hypothetical protein
MIPLARNGYTEQEIKDVLHGKHGTRTLDYRYDLLDKNDVFIRTLTNVLGGEVSMGALNEAIKRSARFEIIDDGSIDWLNDRIKPYVLVKMETEKISEGTTWSELSGNSWNAFSGTKMNEVLTEERREYVDKYAEFPLGVFLLDAPTRGYNGMSINVSVSGFDASSILVDDTLTERYLIPAGTNYLQAIIDILASAGITKYNIDQTDKTVPTDIEFEPGKQKIFIINELLRAINFVPIYVDVNGFFTSMPYRTPDVRAVEYTYKTDSLSITHNGYSETLDLRSIPNKWVRVVSDAERTLTSTYINENPNSKTSTVSLGRTVTDYKTVSGEAQIADQSSLDAYVERIAFEASQIYGHVRFETAIMPMHDYMDCLQIEFDGLGINDKFVETGWRFQLVDGGRMTHECRKVVKI